MSYQYQQCALCGSEDIEKISEDHYTCKRCGLGTNGKLANFEDHWKFLKETVSKIVIKYPNLSNKQITDKVQNTLHKVEKHPLDEKGFCIYCRRSFR